MERRFLELKNGGKLVVCGNDSGEVLQPVEVLQGAQAIEGEVHLLQIFKFPDALSKPEVRAGQAVSCELSKSPEKQRSRPMHSSRNLTNAA